MITLEVDNTNVIRDKIAVVIPARLQSTRFPQKMLKEVTPGVPLIKHVYNQVCKMWSEDDVYVATDSQEILDMFGDKGILTDENCANGTARVAEASNYLTDYNYFINVQGDMIDIPEDALDLIAEKLRHNRDVVTICTEMDEIDQLNPSVVKCINNGKQAHWFGRSSVPYGDWHLGIYGYKRNALHLYPVLRKYAEEDIESLEQLRWIQNNVNVTITYTSYKAAEINTPEDLIKWQQTRQS